MAKERFLCCCATISIVAGLLVLATWLIVNSIDSPQVSLLDLQLPVINNNNNTNMSLSFKLKLDNPNFNIGIQYSNLTTSFHYPTNQPSAFADVIVPAFYQGYRKKAVKTGTGNTSTRTEVINGAAATVRVHVVGTVRFKRVWWVSARRLSVEGLAGVDRQGYFASEKGLQLKSGAAATKLSVMGWCLLLSLAVLSNLVLTC